jgi:hypothetical protein
MRNITLAALIIGMAGAAATAEVFDDDSRAGLVRDVLAPVVVYNNTGATPASSVRVWSPWMFTASSSLFNNTQVSVVDGDILGAVTTFSSAGNPNLVAYFQTYDQLDDNGAYTSNNVVIDEFPNSRSNTLGQILADGRIIYRANFAGTDQNNLETLLGDVKSQSPSFPEPDMGDEILDGPGTTGQAGDVFLGVPAALAVDADSMWVGNTNFDSFSGDVPRGVNFWLYSGTPRLVASPDHTYTQSAAETFANANGFPIDSGDGRQTQPVLAEVEGVRYNVHGVNDTDLGGSARPAFLVVDAFEDGDAYTGAVLVAPPAGQRFIDHQATGGGSSPFEDKHFDMNAAGQLVALTEDSASVPTFRVLLYNPIITGGRITGFEAPIVVADAGPTGTVADGLAGPIDSGDPGDPWINSISGTAINDAGNISFTAIYDTGEVDPDSGEPILATAAYLYNDTDEILYQLVREDDVIGNTLNGGQQVSLGLFAQEGSDSHFAGSLADNADVVACNYRDSGEPDGGVRGVIVMALGYEGDANFDGTVNLSDLGELLASFGAVAGTPAYNPEVDFNNDGQIDLSDLGTLLANFE